MKTIDDLVAAAAPVTDEQLTEVHLGPAPTARLPRTTRRRVALAAVCVAMTGVVAGPVAADVLSARTGLFGSGQEDGRGEILRLDSPAMKSLWPQFQQNYRLPPGGTWDAFTRRMIRPGSDYGVATEQVVDQLVAFEARCQWERAWLDGEPTALAVLEQIPSWPALTRSDPADGGEGGMVYQQKQLAKAARDGDREPIEQDVAVNCA